jgi:hydroxymethylbilane synthase
MKKITIGARGSKLSLAYAAKVKRLILKSESKLFEKDIKIQSIKTSGDIFYDKKLSEIGGKNLFCKEIEESLITKEIDIAVHSLKDMASEEIPSLNIAAYIERNDPRDVFVSFKHSNLKELNGGVMGSSSRRRDLQLKLINKDVLVKNIRGNIDTRIQKLKDGLYDGIVLALAGIKTLKLEKNVKHIFSAEEMLPAVGQGIIAAQCRKDDTDIIKLLKKINNEETKQCAAAERSLLKTLGGDCDTAVGGLATIKKNELTLSAQLFSDSGDQDYTYKIKGKREDGLSIGTIVGIELLKKAGNNFKKK